MFGILTLPKLETWTTYFMIVMHIHLIIIPMYRLRLHGLIWITWTSLTVVRKSDSLAPWFIDIYFTESNVYVYTGLEKSHLVSMTARQINNVMISWPCRLLRLILNMLNTTTDMNQHLPVLFCYCYLFHNFLTFSAFSGDITLLNCECPQVLLIIYVDHARYSRRHFQTYFLQRKRLNFD